MDISWLPRRLFGGRDETFTEREQLEWTTADHPRVIAGVTVRESVEPALDEAAPD
jgi:hypothetical protein